MDGGIDQEKMEMNQLEEERRRGNEKHGNKGEEKLIDGKERR